MVKTNQKMAAVNKKLKFVILQQVISILLLQIIAASEYYQYSRILHITFKFL